MPGGTTTCAKPGTGTGDCGAGITKGEKLVFNLQYDNGFTYMTQFMEQLKCNLEASDGIQLEPHDGTVQHGHRQRGAVQGRAVVHVGDGELGPGLVVRPGLLPDG